MAVSKNNPNSRKAQIQKLYNGKVIKPVKYIGPFGTYIAAQYEDGTIIMDGNSEKPAAYKQLETSISGS